MWAIRAYFAVNRTCCMTVRLYQSDTVCQLSDYGVNRKKCPNTTAKNVRMNRKKCPNLSIRRNRRNSKPRNTHTLRVDSYCTTPPEGAGKGPRDARRPAVGLADLRRDTPCPAGTPTGAGATASPLRGFGHLLTVSASRNPAPSRDAAAGSTRNSNYCWQGACQCRPVAGVAVGVGFPAFDSSGYKVNWACRRGYRRCASKRGRPRAKASSWLNPVWPRPLWRA